MWDVGGEESGYALTMRIDLHNHVVRRSPDSELEVGDMVRVAQNCGLDAVCITDHENWMAVSEAERLSEIHQFPLFGGIELSLPGRGHFLIFGDLNLFDGRVERRELLPALAAVARTIEDLADEVVHVAEVRRLFENSTLARMLRGVGGALDLVQRVHEQGGAIVWAHPLSHNSLRALYDGFFHRYPLSSMEDFACELAEKHEEHHRLILAVDALEAINGSSPELGMINHQVAALARSFDRPTVGGSDAHSRGGCGRAATLFDSPVRCAADLVDALRGGRCKAVTLSEELPSNSGWSR